MTESANEGRRLSWLGRVFRQRLAEHEVGRRERFEHVMRRARAVAEADPLGLSTLVRLIAAPLQARATTSLVFRPIHGARGAYNLSDFFGSPPARVTADGMRVDQVGLHLKDARYRLRLGRDPILAVPWKEPSFTNAIANMGYARRMGEWREDFNHKVELLLPFGLALVHGGNHSLAAGITNAEGTVVAETVIDLAPLYAHVRYDGASMIRTHDGFNLWTPVDEELGILFEIGRVMVEYGVRYDAQVAADSESNSDESDESFPICYRVLVDGQDTGYSLSTSGATRALLQAEIEPGSAESRSVIVEGFPMLRSWPIHCV
ncbi:MULTISPECIES: DUF6710 family protein [unclassified Pseudomonas]|uniref:DUF6710 family protein n=1 Tax=unclassified Pseudomonas TaxID=196821 RepID=UPI000C88B1FD|nr:MULTISPECIES: DUF6710 family protein [unclassified Pseudomonas]PMX27612.1 hypothetical protein C1Y23_08100 [Pseudomonas sp. GW460-12]PMX35555.1 hypothetical protein C1Y24_09185 [Pseudomonas sp. MPR-R2A4]PMX42204.1 hypothetical protein C1Y26_07330 [Pseudomonas sp. MPR-R2A7]PMX53690.1 hypothetical protein C1Y17_12085 [Pseudomonas sp. MPR-R2A6]PMX90610.1 hypothetical protein C1Y21_15090 [Pseudomonas sp. MPR-R2A3]